MIAFVVCVYGSKADKKDDGERYGYKEKGLFIFRCSLSFHLQVRSLITKSAISFQQHVPVGPVQSPKDLERDKIVFVDSQPDLNPKNDSIRIA